MIAAPLERSLPQTAAQVSPFKVVESGCLPQAWAAYGRFIFFSVSMRRSHCIQTVGRGLHYFRREFLKQDASICMAFQDRDPLDATPWDAAERALRSISAQGPLDHLNVFVEGPCGSELPTHPTLRSLFEGAYIAQSASCETHDVLELAPTYEEFLARLGRHLRRDLRRRRTNALKAGLTFEISRHPHSITRQECYKLGKLSRPCAFSRDTIDAWDSYAQSQPGFFHCALRDSSGKLLSYCTAFAEGDSVVMVYQLNDKNYPDLALTMSLRGFLIEHCIESGLQRLVLPMGISGHLRHAATVQQVTQVLFVRRSPSSIAKAFLIALFRPFSPQARLFKTRGFLAWALTGREPLRAR
jgi:hypothetical protein